MFECGLRRAGHTVHMQIDLQTTNYTEKTLQTEATEEKPAISGRRGRRDRKELETQ